MGWCAAKLDHAFFSASADFSEDLSAEKRPEVARLAVVEYDREATRNIEPQTCTVCRDVAVSSWSDCPTDSLVPSATESLLVLIRPATLRFVDRVPVQVVFGRSSLFVIGCLLLELPSDGIDPAGSSIQTAHVLKRRSRCEILLG